MAAAALAPIGVRVTEPRIGQLNYTAKMYSYLVKILHKHLQMFINKQVNTNKYYKSFLHIEH